METPVFFYAILRTDLRKMNLKISAQSGKYVLHENRSVTYRRGILSCRSRLVIPVLGIELGSLIIIRTTLPNVLLFIDFVYYSSFIMRCSLHVVLPSVYNKNERQRYFPLPPSIQTRSLNCTHVETLFNEQRTMYSPHSLFSIEHTILLHTRFKHQITSLLLPPSPNPPLTTVTWYCNLSIDCFSHTLPVQLMHNYDRSMSATFDSKDPQRVHNCQNFLTDI